MNYCINFFLHAWMEHDWVTLILLVILHKALTERISIVNVFQWASPMFSYSNVIVAIIKSNCTQYWATIKPLVYTCMLPIFWTGATITFNIPFPFLNRERTTPLFFEGEYSLSIRGVLHESDRLVHSHKLIIIITYKVIISSNMIINYFKCGHIRYHLFEYLLLGDFMMVRRVCAQCILFIHVHLVNAW